MRLEDFDFQLPERLIALRPQRPRDDARLLVVHRSAGSIEDRRMTDLPKLLKRGDVLVFNDTRVLPAKLKAQRASRASDGTTIPIDINLNRRLAADAWSAFARPGKRIRAGDTLELAHDLTASVTEIIGDGEIALRFNCSGQALDELIERTGEMPLPPYINSKRRADDDDRRDYQTVFARETGSVAAPTAGLHFTPELLAALRDCGVEQEAITLHVNAGTFLPVKADDITQHKMHPEFARVPEPVATRIRAAKALGRRCIPVGTTALRTLESASAGRGMLEAFEGDTSIFIKPGYPFVVTDGLVTNFHLPRSTLFMLVCALMGVDLMRAAYHHAISAGYRFYSYGDACLLVP